MKAMRLNQVGAVEDNPLTMANLPVPAIRRNEILLKVKACGVCHTDLHTVEGDLNLPKLPLTPGHQVVATVEERGDSVTRFAKGDRVGVTWFYSSCGTCKFCSEGRENLCTAARFTGLHADGGYAEFMVGLEQSTFMIPEIFSDAEATPLLCGGVIGFRSLKLSEVKSGENLGLYGFGNSAHVVIQIAVDMGCNVYVFTRSRNHQHLARELGAVWVGTADDTPPEPMHSSIVFAPVGFLVPKALKALDRGGTIALAGITMTPIPEMDYELIYGERTVRSVANTTAADAEELLRVAAGIPVRTEVETFALDEANQALRMMKESRLKAGGALLL